MLTLAPAMAWGFTDRGLLREGMVADVNVFDPERVGPAVPEVVRDLPRGGKRLSQTVGGVQGDGRRRRDHHRRRRGHRRARPGRLVRSAGSR